MPPHPPTLFDRLLGWVSVRRWEAERAFLTAGYLFLVIASYLLLKAVRNSLFISEFGAMKLPYVMLGIAVLAGAFAAPYIRLSRRMPGPRLVFWSLLFFASNVVAFWWLARQSHPWLYPVLYLWAGVYGVIAPTQVWTLANDLFTTREAKRVFGVVGAGGILGALAGGALTNRLAPIVGTTNLLLVVAGLLLAASVMVALLARERLIPRPVAAGLHAPGGLADSLRAISSSDHLRLLAALVFISALATTSIDFQFSVVAENSVTDRDQLTAFFGVVYGGVSFLAFILQLVLTSHLLRRFGVGFAILLLPLALLGGTVALLASGALWAAVALKGADGTFKHSIDRSCRELMYLPLPANIKLQAKSTIDTVMDRMGDGSAGALQLLVTAGLGWGLRGSLAVNAVVVGLWCLLARRLRGEYVAELRRALGRASPPPRHS